MPSTYTAGRSCIPRIGSDQRKCNGICDAIGAVSPRDHEPVEGARMSTRPTVRRLVGEDLASEQMLALMREAAGLPVVELRRIIAEELALMEVVGTGLQGAPTSVAAYVSRSDGVVLEYIAVAPELRGDGIGRALVDALAGGAEPVVAETDDDAVGFYRALDFDIGPAPSDPRWPGRRRYRCVRWS